MNDPAEIGTWRKLLFGDGLGARLARGGTAALAIRLAGVALSYLMFVVLARHMTEDDFGRFGFAFSLATFIAVIAALGQPLLVLRFVPTYKHEDLPLLLNGLVRDSRLALLAGALASAILMLLGIRIWSDLAGTNAAYLMWSVPLMFGMAVAQHQAFLLRAFGDIFVAMSPRDIFWRIAVIAAVLLAAQRGEKITALHAINICSVILVSILAVQMFAHRATRPGTRFLRNFETDRGLWLRESKGLWAVTAVQAAGPNLSVVVLGLILLPEQTGPFFAAMKTATLLTLPLAAGVIVGAPLISRYYHAGETRKVQLVSSYLVLGITAPVLVGFVLILIFGKKILGVFGPDFVVAHAALLLISFGTLVNALSGPTTFIMNMTGHHNHFLFIMTVTQLTSLMLLPIATYLFGILGAAAIVAAGMISWNIWVWRWSRKNLSVDPTIFGVVEWLLGRNSGTVPSDEKA